MARSLFLAVLMVVLVPGSYGAAPPATELRGLIVLIDFPDAEATVPLSRVDNLINGIGYTEPAVSKSLRDYWYAQSRGKVDLTHQVIGYYRAPHPTSYYNAQTFEAFITLAREALDWIVETHPEFDWDALSLASGPMNRNGTEEGTLLSLSFLTTAWIPGTGGTHWLTGWTAPNGVTTQQMVGGTLQSPWDPDINMFWLTHEQGHSVWGWPDTYDNLGNSSGTGLYSVMSGNHNGDVDVEPVGAPFLLEEGWVRSVEIKRRQTIVMEPDGDTVARYYNPDDPREYFAIEARQNTTVGNSAFPAPIGLVIWHVDERVTTYNTRPQMTPAEHYRISIEQADGQFDLENHVNAGDAGDIFVPGTVFSPSSLPNSSWWDGTPSGLTVDDIRFLPNGRISFRVSVR